MAVEGQARHFVDSRQLSPDLIGELYERTVALRMGFSASDHVFKKSDRTVDIIFYGPSDITLRSFFVGANRLGLNPYPNPIPEQTTWGRGKGEEHQIEVANWQGSYAIALRSREVGGAERAAKHSEVPVINAGEGFSGQSDAMKLVYFPQHPTQGLSDGFTVCDRFRTTDNLHFLITGDIRRNPVGFSWLLTYANFPGAKIILATQPYPNTLPKEVETYIKQRGANLSRTANLDKALSRADVVCIAHSQNTIRSQVPGVVEIGSERLKPLPSHAIIMHDLIKGHLPEVAEEVTVDPRLVYKQQIKNGVFTRMAILEWVGR